MNIVDYIPHLLHYSKFTKFYSSDTKVKANTIHGLAIKIL